MLHEVELTVSWRHRGENYPPKTRLRVPAHVRDFMRQLNAIRDPLPQVSASVDLVIGESRDVETGEDEATGDDEAEDPEPSGPSSLHFEGLADAALFAAEEGGA